MAPLAHSFILASFTVCVSRSNRLCSANQRLSKDITVCHIKLPLSCAVLNISFSFPFSSTDKLSLLDVNNSEVLYGFPI